ncbi:MAG: cadherin-like beta sandwich domain-containing protein [Bacteroides sp.]|nr:cadherin-like beta sandwich domain-containing protein [Bacteroides sp.]MCM1550192.1 cadherin-like beta sandwich domain-containing protein [Clostridium sp.]
MNQTRRKWGIIILIVMLCIVNFKTSVYAAGASVTIAVSQSSLKIGDTLSVTVSIASEGAIGSYSLPVSYNSSVLEYTGGSGNGGGGTVMIAGYGDGSQTRLSATLNFKAIGNGTATIATSGGEAYGWDESVLTISHAGTNVTVAAPQASGEGNTGAEHPSLSGSDDNYLKSLEISPGVLNPSFQSGTTSYTVELPKDTKAIVVSAAANDSKATVSVTHHNDLEPGANKTYVVVTAENGTQRTYVLNVNCGEVTEENKIPPVIIQDMEYTFATAERLEEAAVPEGFEASEGEYEGMSVTTYLSPNRQLHIVYLLNEEGEGQWFIYNQEKKTFLPYIEYRAEANRFIIMAPPEDVDIPSGYAPVETELQGQKLTAYRTEGNPEFLLIYAMNLNGEAGFYLYDTVEGTYQRYRKQEAAIQESEQTEPEELESTESEASLVTENEKLHNLRIVLYLLSGISIVLLGLMIAMTVILKKKLD